MKKIDVDFSYVGTSETLRPIFVFFANGLYIGDNISGMGKARPVKFSTLVRPEVQIYKM